LEPGINYKEAKKQIS